MILTLAYRGTFRQAQYETVTVEGSIAVDTVQDLAGMTMAERRDYMLTQLDNLTAPVIGRAVQASQYSKSETTLYEWEGFINAPSDEAPPRNPHRRVRRGS